MTGARTSLSAAGLAVLAVVWGRGTEGAEEIQSTEARMT